MKTGAQVPNLGGPYYHMTLILRTCRDIWQLNNSLQLSLIPRLIKKVSYRYEMATAFYELTRKPCAMESLHPGPCS